MTEVKIPIGEEKPIERKHTPQMSIGTIVCSVCGKVLGSQDTDKPCPGSQAGSDEKD